MERVLTLEKFMTTGLVYVATSDDVCYKIGYTTLDECQRKYAIQTMTPEGEVRIVLTKPNDYPDVLEKQLHHRFWQRKCNPHRRTGEWFYLTLDDLENLKLENFNYETENYCSTIAGPSPFDDGSLRWRQQNTVAGQRETVFVAGRPTDAPRAQYLFFVDRGEHKKRDKDGHG